MAALFYALEALASMCICVVNAAIWGAASLDSLWPQAERRQLHCLLEAELGVVSQV